MNTIRIPRNHRRQKLAKLVKNRGEGANPRIFLAKRKPARTVLSMNTQTHTPEESTPEFLGIEEAIEAFDAASAAMDAARAELESQAKLRRDVCKFLRHDAGMKLREVSEVLGISTTRVGEYSGTR